MAKLSAKQQVSADLELAGYKNSRCGSMKWVLAELVRLLVLLSSAWRFFSFVLFHQPGATGAGYVKDGNYIAIRFSMIRDAKIIHLFDQMLSPHLAKGLSLQLDNAIKQFEEQNK